MQGRVLARRAQCARVRHSDPCTSGSRADRAAPSAPSPSASARRYETEADGDGADGARRQPWRNSLSAAAQVGFRHAIDPRRGRAHVERPRAVQLPGSAGRHAKRTQTRSRARIRRFRPGQRVGICYICSRRARRSPRCWTTVGFAARPTAIGLAANGRALRLCDARIPYGRESAQALRRC